MTPTEFASREAELGHAIQSGVAMELQTSMNKSATPKHLRVGVNMALIQHAALVRLLINKGIIDEADYFESQIQFMEGEVELYEERLTKYFGRTITLK